MSDTAQEVETCIESLDIPEQLSVLRKLESWAWGAPMWRLLALVFANRADAVLDSSEFPDESAVNDELDRAALAWYAEKYGRVLNKQQLAWMKCTRAAGAPHLTIRDALIGRLCTRKGTTRLDDWRRKALLLLGAGWHATAMLVTFLLLLLSVLLPGPYEIKLIVVPTILVFGAFTIAFINALTFRAALAFETVARYEAQTDYPSLRAL